MMNLDKLVNFIYYPVDSVASVLYPNRCACCGNIIKEDRYICPLCEKEIKIIDPRQRCISCGLEKKSCDCLKYIYYFDGIVSLYINRDLAQRAMYSYKFGHKAGYAMFFAKDMANAVKKEFAGINFDAIIPVPTTLINLLKYGFSPVNEICYALEELLDVKLIKNILRCNRNKKTQHKSKYSERIENVRNSFYCDGKLSAKTVLLVDDIKTTGATLSQCARQLKFAGADRVFCVTALAVTNDEKGIENTGN